MNRLNPELRRYLWLELSPARLVGMPVVIGALMLLVGAWAFEPGRVLGGPRMLEGMATLGSAGFVVLVLFWGARLAANAVVREIAGRTWDQQRLSSAGAWTMTWGKLAGSTVFVAYGCLLLLLLTLVSLACWQVFYGGVEATFRAPLWAVLVQAAVGLIAFAVLVEASVMLIAMTAVARRETGRQLDVSIAQIVVIVVAFSLFSSFSNQGGGADLVWYGLAIDELWFAVASLVAFAGWAVIGLWRRMRVELQVRNWPVMWPLFVLFAAFWAAGFAQGQAAVVVAAVVILMAGYIPAVLEQPDPVRLRRLFGALAQRDARTALRFLPLWLVNHALALLAVAVAALVLLGGNDGEGAQAGIESIDGLAFAAGTLVAFYFFVTRDLLLLVFAALGRGGRRAFATWLLWMAVLYGLVPMILAALGLYASLPVFVPVWDIPFLSFAVPPVLWPLLQVVIVLALIRWRWRRFATGRLAGAASP